MSARSKHLQLLSWHTLTSITGSNLPHMVTNKVFHHLAWQHVHGRLERLACCMCNAIVHACIRQPFYWADAQHQLGPIIVEHQTATASVEASP